MSWKLPQPSDPQSLAGHSFSLSHQGRHQGTGDRGRRGSSASLNVRPSVSCKCMNKRECASGTDTELVVSVGALPRPRKRNARSDSPRTDAATTRTERESRGSRSSPQLNLDSISTTFSPLSEKCVSESQSQSHSLTCHVNGGRGGRRVSPLTDEEDDEEEEKDEEEAGTGHGLSNPNTVCRQEFNQWGRSLVHL